MDKPRKEHDPDRTRRWVEESNITMPPEITNRSWIVGKEIIERKKTSSTTIEFEKHP